jgi:uncharacterized membrane protein affecting hemolysin expression
MPGTYVHHAAGKNLADAVESHNVRDGLTLKGSTGGNH